MKRFYIVFTTVSCFVLAVMNLYLNHRLYELNETQSYAATSELPGAEAAQSAEGAQEESVTAMVDSARQNTYTADKRDPLYVLGVKDGFIAVFYGKSGSAGVIKEMTSVSADALPADERLRLSQGIPVYNEEQLAKLLQDYGS